MESPTSLEAVRLCTSRGRSFELVINLKTATALGLAIPQSLSLRADQLLQ
jgi:hypothetical protein